MSARENPGDAPDLGQVSAEPAYPIFFPTFTPIPTGYARDWWWYDPSLDPEDQGPFETREEAVADWAVEHLTAACAAESVTLDQAISRLPARRIKDAGQPRTQPGANLKAFCRAVDEFTELVSQSWGVIGDLWEQEELERERRLSLALAGGAA